MGKVTDAKFWWPIYGPQGGGGLKTSYSLNVQSVDLIHNATCMHPCFSNIGKFCCNVNTVDSLSNRDIKCLLNQKILKW